MFFLFISPFLEAETDTYVHIPAFYSDVCGLSGQLVCSVTLRIAMILSN